ncbi:DUF493 domain-containing protein [bacterium]|nr:DUF493 domain-containing protein [bacterium]
MSIDPFKGEKIEYPISFAIKIIVEGDTVAMRKTLETIFYLHHIEVGDWTARASKQKRYTTLSTPITVTSKDHMHNLYHDLETVESVIYIL